MMTYKGRTLLYTIFYMSLLFPAIVIAQEETYLGGQVSFGTRPVPNATIRLVKSSKDSKNPNQKETAYTQVTDSEGKYIFKGLAEGDYDVVCETKDYPLQTKTVTIKKKEPKNVSFLLSNSMEAAANSGKLLSIVSNIDEKTARIFVAYSSTSAPVNPDGSIANGQSAETALSDINDVGVLPYAKDPLGLNKVVSEDPQNSVTWLHPNNVSIIDTDLKKVVGLIPSLVSPSWLNFSPDGNAFWVIDSGHDIKHYSYKGDLIGSVSVGSERIITDTAVSGAQTLYVAVRGWEPAIYTVEGDANLLANHVALPPQHGQPGGVAVSPDKRTILVAMGNASSGWLEVIDGQTGEIKNEFEVGAQPMGVGITPNSSKAIVTNYNGSSVDIVDLMGGSKPIELSVGVEPTRVAIRPDGLVAFVTNSADNSLSIIDLRTNQEAARIPVGTSPMGVTCSANGKYVYTANHDSGNVTMIDANTFAVVGTTPTISGVYVFGVGVRP